MDFFDLQVPTSMATDIIAIMKYYDYKYKITDSTDDKIYRIKANTTTNYSNVEEFLLGEIFYKKKKNLHYYVLDNPNNEVCNLDTSPISIIDNHPLLKHMLSHSIFKTFITTINNYGTFIRFSENKVQRLYWNPPLNAGIPLTAKEKDPVYELIFLMHDFGHFILPDLVPTGETDEMSKKIYVNWRLLGESITVVLNEMILVDHLKDKPEFKQMLKLDFDKPFKLYQIFKPINLTNVDDLRKLFYASYLYFCMCNPSGFLDLIDKEKYSNWDAIWNEFNQRYRPVAERGREWTESNFENIRTMSKSYEKWYHTIAEFKNYLELKTIDDLPCYTNTSMNDTEIMNILFQYVFMNTLIPIFFSSKTQLPHDYIKRKSFVRYMVGNLFLLIKFENNYEYSFPIIQKMKSMTVLAVDDSINDIKKDYRMAVESLYDSNLITINEYHNYKNIFIMIPPNIMKKDIY
ncbi:hypothetical protein QJ856_gp1196 [Tupanvirus deep ocean]|uniref:Uncharacterized protein n=2 Tax=Tupanvirus TaxID=2094720 RepID=A0AC62A6Z9_9VIRU|nr:hypothetical protein QJ856_gp1196 [Tupanvirus deep ocean]QKU33565.1 hypothetical protein [Tupanvirus deep ocean]